MLFKDLLTESKDSKFRSLIKLLKKDEWILQKPFLYRGRGGEPEFAYEIREKRKEREPKDTAIKTNNIVSCLHNVFLPEFPHRERSVFSTYDRTVTRDYGVYDMLVVPHETAKISWSEADAWWSFFKEMEPMIDSLSSRNPTECLKWNKDESEHHRMVFDLIQALVNSSSAKNCSKLKKYKEEYGNPFVNSTAFMTLRNKLENEPSTCFLNSQKVVSNLEKYFRNLHLGYPNNKESFYETAIEGKYIYINLKTFLDHHKEKFEKEFGFVFEDR